MKQICHYNDENMNNDHKYDYLMNIASSLFFICYIPDFYANYKNKNANFYNVFEKIVLICGSAFALSYSMNIQNNILVTNYIVYLHLDTISLFIRLYYAYRNRHIDVTIKIAGLHNHVHIQNHNPLHQITVLQEIELWNIMYILSYNIHNHSPPPLSKPAKMVIQRGIIECSQYGTL
jgi:lipid-A-disaccharide synthase-like uncharacterized protein